MEEENYSTYNLKLSKKAYFKLKKIELIQEENGTKKTKNELINELILSYE